MTNASSRNLIRPALLAVFMCALPAVAGDDVYGLGNGQDGAASVTGANTVVNLYARVSSPLGPGDNSITIASNPGITVGDLIMVLQTTGIVPDPVSGGPAFIDLSNDPVGRWELSRVLSVTPGAGTTVFLGLDQSLLYSYAANVTQVILVREYTSISVSSPGSLIPGNWNGSTGGVLAFLSQGLVSITSAITGTSRGFKGGQGVQDNLGLTGCTDLDQFAPTGAQKGEGIAVTQYNTTRATGRGRIANGGGGGVCMKSGGGGGGNSGAGGEGGFSEDGFRPVGGQGGASLGFNPVSRLLPGGGGGPGHIRSSTLNAGGQGGGIVFIRGGRLASTGTLIADGANAPNNTAANADAAAGGGAGGTLYLRFAGTADCDITRVHAWGGTGGNTTGGAGPGPGGGGGGGRILFQACGGGTCVLPASAVVGGQPGSAIALGNSSGAQTGGDGQITVLPGCYSPLSTPVVVTPADGSSTNDATPLYTGTLMQPYPVGTEVIIYVDGVEVGRVVPDAAGNWSFTQPTNLTDGTHTVYAVAINTAQGLQSSRSDTNTFTVDSTPPAAPVVVTPANGSITNSVPTYSGTAVPGSIVTVIVDGTVVGTTTADAAGNWSLPQPTALAEGSHTVKATARDAVGNTSADSNTNTFTVDTTPPPAPVVITPADGLVTNNNRPTYSGTAVPGSIVTVIVDGTSVGTITADAAGNWSLPQPTALAEGSHTVKATARDAVGNTSADSNTNTFTVDTTPPPAPVVITPADGLVTNNNRPTYSGTAVPGSIVTVIVDGTSVGTTTADAAGNWSLPQPTALAEGSHTVKATARDAAGNTSADSNTNTFTVDTTSPPAPVVITPADGLVTNNNRPTYSGTAVPGSTVTVIVDGTSVGTTTADAAGNWSLPQPTALADGNHTVKATARDAVGNISADSNTNTFTVDTTPPPAPVVITPADGLVTNNNRPTYSGTAVPGSIVTVIVDGASVGTTTADAAGNWSLPQPTALADGNHTVKATARDAAGNTSADSNTNTFTVDTTPPPAPVVITPADGSVTNNNRPTYSGTAVPGSTVTVIVDGTSVGTTTADAAGNWSLPQPTALADGNHTVKATARDAAGNTSVDSNTNTFTVDTTPPPAPVVITPADGLVTNNNRPTYSGTAVPGSIVTVIVDGASVGTITADVAGNWSLPQPTALADGNHTVKATARDAAGNTSADSNTNTFTVDTTPPPAPVVITPADGLVTNNNRPTYSGTAVPGSIVTVIVDGTSVGTTTADAAGNWSLPQPTALADGNHTVKATARDAAGNTSVDSNTNTFTVDTTPPPAPVVITPADGSVTNNNQPTYSGTAVPGSTVTVIVDGSSVGTTTADAAGNWSLPQPTALADGTHVVKATARDAAGNTSVDSNTNTFTVDTIPPPAPVVITPANGLITFNNRPTYSGTAVPGSIVTVIVDGAVVGTTTADASGSWNLTQPTALADGNHTVKATARDAAGNTSVDSNTNAFTVDTIPPPAPVVVTPADGSVTNNNRPTYGGTAEPGSTVFVIVDGAVVGSTTADAAGNWSLPQPAALVDGTHTVKAMARDAANNASADSNTNTFTVDTIAPAAPVVTAPADGSVTNDTTPTYMGTAVPGSTVTVIVDGTSVGTATANGAGGWSFTPVATLADGPHAVKATARDAAGNTSVDSNTNIFTVDTVAPVAPVVTAPANSSITNDNTPTYMGTAEVNSTVTVIVDGTPVGTTTADGAGNWSLPQPTALVDGNHTVTARAADAAGNISANSNTNTFTVDTVAPVAPVVTAPANGSVTNDNTPTYTGTAEANSTVTVIVDGTPVGTTTANGAGSWSFPQPTALADGTHTVKATARDAAGNVSPASNTNSFTVDTTAPATPVVNTPADGSTISDNTPTYSGTAEANSTVTVIVDGRVVGTTTADASGAWSFTPTLGLMNDSHTVKATAEDTAGNISPESNTNTFIVDATIPAAPVVITPVHNSVTNDTTPDFTGTAEADATVTIFLGSQQIGSTTADATGHWSFTPTAALAAGMYDVSALATNAVGNASEQSNINRFTIDTTPPGAPVITTPANDSVTNDSTPTISGTAEPDSTVTVMLNGSSVGTATTNAAGSWSFTPATPLADGPYTVVVTARDVAGNTSAPSNSVRFVIDTTPPETTIVSGPSGETQDPDATFDFGSSEPGVTYECKLDGADFTACSDPTTFANVSEGEHILQVRSRDTAGNVDPTPATATWTYHPPPPPPSDWALLGNGAVGCAASGGDPSSLAMMALGVISALLARRRRR